MTFLVWKRGPRGPVASRDTFDPRQLSDWKLLEQQTVAIIPLAGKDEAQNLDTLKRLYPCPAYEV